MGCHRAANTFEGALQALEARAGGRLGVAVWDPAKGVSIGYRMRERFPMCSTFKLALAGVILSEADADRLRLEKFIQYTDADMLPYAPVTQRHLTAGGMSVGALAEAAQTTSDNVAANLLLDQLHGPAGFTSLLRRLGDAYTRLDRYEPEMNYVPAGEERDTTTPRAMAHTVAAFFTGGALSPQSKSLLRQWMEATKTGARRLRAGFPPHWPAGDKTGTGIVRGMSNQYNDVAVVWRETTNPVVIAAYYEAEGEFDRIRPEDEGVLRDVGRLASARIAL